MSVDPSDLADLSLDELLIGAAEAPPNERVKFRNPIAAKGGAAVAALEPWLTEPGLAGFAVRTIARAAELDRSSAVAALRSGLSKNISDVTRQDIEKALRDLGAPQRTATSPRNPKPPTAQPTGSPDDLVRGQIYKRRELHQMLGGNWQKGISYPARGWYVLLFSDPNSLVEHGYNDRWDSNDAYWYYGEWSGTGDMTMTGGNREIVGRSPNLYLFTAKAGGHRYEGQFLCDGHKTELTSHDERTDNAIVFHLVRG